MTSKFFLFATLSLLTLSACTSTPVATEKAIPVSQITYEHLKAIPINVKRINVTSATQRGAKAWDITDTMVTPPDTAMRRYLAQRFKANSADGILNVHLAKAEVIKDEAPNENKFLSYIPLANNEDYTIEIVVDLESQYMSGLPDSKTSSRFVRKVRMPLNVTMSYREAKLQRTLEEMIRDIDEGMISTLANQMGLISRQNVPVYAIDVKTPVPKTQTKFGELANDVGDGMRNARTAVGESLESMGTDETTKATTVQPVQITPLEK